MDVGRFDTRKWQAAMQFVLVVASASASIPTTTLPGGAELPSLYMGMGNFTQWCELAGKGAGVKTAWEYHNQESVAAQISGFKRENVFLESMIPCGFVDHPDPMNASAATDYIKQDLQLLNTTYLDLLAIHHRCNTPEETAAVWGALEAALDRGDAKSIGVSNFDASDLAELLKVAKKPIAVNEAHFALGMMDFETMAFAKAHNIQLISFSSLSAAVPMDHPLVTAVATSHNVSSAAIMLKYVSTYGIAVLSSMSKLEYGMEDIGIFDFELSAEEMRQLDALQTGKRTCPDCFTDECQHCAQALIDHSCPVGKMPAWGRDNPQASECLECAAKANSSVITTCKAQFMVEKACGQAGGFPHLK